MIIMGLIIAAGLYAALAKMLADPAHRTLYPLIGFGHPLTGRRLMLVRIFSPFVLLGIGLARLPMFVVLVLIALRYSTRGN
jgi:hypothetical protein